MWERSTHAKKLDATLNETCRTITGCLKPTNTNSLPLLAGIAPPPPDIRRVVASRTERTRQTTDQRRPLNDGGNLRVVPHVKLQRSFIKCTERKLLAWSCGENDSSSCMLHACVHLNISADEHLPAGAENPWTTWKALNQLRRQVGRLIVNMLKWGFSNEAETCDCGIRQTMINTAGSTQDLITANGITISCARHWEGTI